MLWVREAPYSDRHEAGERLARLLAEEERLCGGISRSGLVVLAAPRGGVAVAVPVADALGAPLDIILARKLPAPGNPELGIGALGEGDVRIVDRELVELFGLREEEIEEIAREVEVEVARRAERYRQRWPAVPLEGACALIIDDGVATGSTLEAAIESARAKGARWVGAAAPVSSAEAEKRIDRAADLFICPLVDPAFIGVGAYYESFPQISDDEVLELLASSRE